MPLLRILILSDGRPGHFNLSEGIAAAAGRDLTTEITRIDVRRGKWSGALLAAMSTAHLPAAVMLQKIYGISPAQLPPVDLVVSAGAETLAANIWAARILAVPNIFYGSLRLFDPQDFALVLTSYARQATRPRHQLALKPANYDPDANTPDITPEPPPHRAPWPPNTAALVVGGDAGKVRFAPGDWDRLISFLEELHHLQGTRWLVANSRRTPDAISDRLATCAKSSTTGIMEFLDVRTAGAGTLIPLLRRSDIVFCTADSSSMLSECIWLRRPVLSLGPDVCPLPKDERQYRGWLEQNRWTAEMRIADLTAERAARTASRLSPLTTNPQQDLASVLRRFLTQLPMPN